jgi:hypothetical protein
MKRWIIMNAEEIVKRYKTAADFEVRLTKGRRYNLDKLRLVGWTKGDGSGHEEYNVEDYFRNDIYLGPDQHGIEPILVQAC